MPISNPSSQSLGTSTLRTVVRILILVLASSLFFFLYQQHQFRGLTEPAAMENAQLGRAMAEGRGYRTRVLRPLDIGYIARHQTGTAAQDDFPELRIPPLYPAALAAAFRLAKPNFTVQPMARAFAPESRVIIPLNWIFTLATAVLLLLVAQRIFDWRIAGLAPVVFLLSHTVLQRTLSGLPDPAATLVAAGALAIALLGAPRSGEADHKTIGSGLFTIAAGMSGILTGLAILCDYSLMLFIPAPLIVCAMHAPPRRQALIMGVYAAGLLAVMAPWIAHNLRVSGYPFGLAHLSWMRGTAAFPEHRLDRALTWNPDALRIGQLLRLRGLSGLAESGWIARWCAGGEALFPALALLALLMPNSHRGLRVLRWPILSAAVLMLLVDPVLAADTPGQILYPMLPWMMLMGSASLVGLLDLAKITWPLIRQASCGIILLLHATPLIAVLLKPPQQLPYPPLYPPFVAAACALVEPDELMVSDMPWATAWYGNQRTLWLPNRITDFYTINDTYQTVAALYLTTETSGRAYVGDLLEGRHQDWLPLVNGNIPEGFPLTDGLRLPPGRHDQIILISAGRFVESPYAE